MYIHFLKQQNLRHKQSFVQESNEVLIHLSLSLWYIYMMYFLPIKQNLKFVC